MQDNSETFTSAAKLASQSRLINLQKSSSEKAFALKVLETRKPDKLSVISRNLIETKERRKLVESNAQLLMNRIQALSNQEHKLNKTIAEIATKSHSLLNYRVNHEKSDKKKPKERNVSQDLGRPAEDIEKLRVTVSRAKAREEATGRKVKDMLMNERWREAQQVREQKSLDKERLMQARTRYVENKQALSQQIRQEQELGYMKIKEFIEVKGDLIREEKAKHIKQEEKRILEKEREIMRLNKVEDEVLGRLSKAEGTKVLAMQEYSTIAKSSKEELEDKFSHILETEPTPNPARRLNVSRDGKGTMRTVRTMSPMAMTFGKLSSSPLMSKSCKTLKIPKM